MQLKYLRVRNFRAHSDFEIDFTDDLGQARPLTVISGPNGSGKTAVLDAIWFGLQGAIGYRFQREHFRPDKQVVVRSGANYAEVEFEISIAERERELINAWRNELVARKAIGPHRGPETTEAHLTWTYPAQPGYEPARFGDYGGYQFHHGFDWAVLLGKKYASRLARINSAPLAERYDVGGVYFFEQERRITALPVRQHSAPVSADEGDAEFQDQGVEQGKPAGNSDFDLRAILIDLGVKMQLPRQRSNGLGERHSWYQIIRDSFNFVCAPHHMGDVFVSNADEYDIEFTDEAGTRYAFDGLSSGERSVLYFLTSYVFRRMRNSIVLIDELEIHLHPTWQRRLIQRLTRMGDGNQFILTTHSPVVLSAVPADGQVDLGILDDTVAAPEPDRVEG